MKKKVILMIFTVLALTFAACGQESGRRIVIKSNGTYINAEDYPAPSTTEKEKAAEPVPSLSQTARQTAQTPDGEGDSAENGEVFWTEGGEVWHLKKDCSSLSRSKNILSGSVDDAIGAGKERACMRCAG